METDLKIFLLKFLDVTCQYGKKMAMEGPNLAKSSHANVHSSSVKLQCHEKNVFFAAQPLKQNIFIYAKHLRFFRRRRLKNNS
jgi:hypothetical protein